MASLCACVCWHQLDTHSVTMVYCGIWECPGQKASWYASAAAHSLFLQWQTATCCHLCHPQTQVSRLNEQDQELDLLCAGLPRRCCQCEAFEHTPPLKKPGGCLLGCWRNKVIALAGWTHVGFFFNLYCSFPCTSQFAAIIIATRDEALSPLATRMWNKRLIMMKSDWIHTP